MKIMLKKFRYFLLLVTALVFITGIQDARACHFAAADIYVTYVGKGADGCSNPDYKYRITLTVYYACQNCFLEGGNQQMIDFGSESLGPTSEDTVKVWDADEETDTLHQLCGQFADSNSCTNPDPNAGAPDPYRVKNFPGFRSRVYVSREITLSAATDWKFWWSNGGRNASNLGGCGNLYVEAGLNNVTKYNNSTPRFTSNPLPYICVNQPTTYLNNPIDINGDSMNVFQQVPYDFNATPCTYIAGYSVADPIGSTVGNPYTLNLYTGAATFTPVNTGFYVFGFRLEDYEYGTGTPLSYVYRDVQVSVLPCNAPPPNIDTLSKGITSIKNATIVKSKTYGDAVFVCPGSNMDVSLNTVSPNMGANVYMYGNTENFTGSSFSTVGQGTRNVTGTFSWTPDESHIGQHNLVVTSKDSTCLISQPIVLTSYRVIVINVLRGIDAGPDVKVCEFNPHPVPLYVYGAEDLRVKWTLDGGPAFGISNDAIHNPTVTMGKQVSYVVTTPDLAGACKATDTVATIIDPGDGVLITPRNPVDTNAAFVLCRPGYMQLEAFPRGRGRKDNIPCGVVLPKDCQMEESNTVHGSILFPDKAYDSLSKYAFDLDNKVRTAKMEYLIHRTEMKKADIWAGTLRSMALTVKGGDNPNYEYANFKIHIKCTEKDELNPVEGYQDPLTMTEVFSAPTYLFTDGEHKFDFTNHYNWDTSKNLIIQMSYNSNVYVDTCGGSDIPALFQFVPTAYNSSLFLKPGPSPFNPQVPDSTVMDYSGTTTHGDIKGYKTRPITKFFYCEVPGLEFVMSWFYGEQMSDSTHASTLVYVPKSSHYVAQTIGRSGCITRDTLYVYVPDHDIKITPGDTAICIGDKAPIQITGGYHHYWYEYENGQYIKPTSVVSPASGYTFIGPEKTTEYRIVVSDSVFCYDTIAARVRVLPLPDVRILNQDDTTIRYGQSIQLLASGARFYNWSPVMSLNNPNISYPIGRPMEDTKYIVGGIGVNGCRAFDTLHVIVDKRDNLFVPSAFSPNGDGKNDVFRITNLSFQRIMEFRVFNRQGLEVFSTNDSRAGWDGTYAGVPQDIGTYMYLIRVAYPDGFVETYKGETTLIR